MINKEKLPLSLPGETNYFLAIVSTFLTYKKKLIKVSAKEFSWEGKVLNFVIANAKYFGNSIGIAPHAEISDGKFAITNIGDISLIAVSYTHLDVYKRQTIFIKTIISFFLH